MIVREEPSATCAWSPTSCRTLTRGSPAALDLLALGSAAAGCPTTWCRRHSSCSDAMPLTPNGKLDRQALPEPEGTGLAAGYVAPTTAEETLLCELVAALLGVAQVGVADHFFHLGGDSISSLRLVSRARERGLLMTPKDVFLHPVVGDLARVAQSAPNGPPTAAGGDAEGPVPATPIIRRLLTEMGPWTGFNQAVLLQVPARLDETALVAALQALLDHHDALRLRVTEDGGLVIPPAGSVSAHTFPPAAQLAGLPAAEHNEALRRACEDAMTRLDPAAGALMQAVWVKAAPHESGRLLLVIHHLAVDGVSWRILESDLAEAYAAALAGEAINLPPKTTSFRLWAEALVATASLHRHELPFWAAMATRVALPLVTGTLNPARDTAGSACQIERSLSVEATVALLTTVPSTFHARINDVLLTALVLATATWRGGRGETDSLAVRVDIEGHGREPIDPTIDLTYHRLVHDLVSRASRSGRNQCRGGLRRRTRCRTHAQADQRAITRRSCQWPRLWPAALPRSR